MRIDGPKCGYLGCLIGCHRNAGKWGELVPFADEEVGLGGEAAALAS